MQLSKAQDLFARTMLDHPRVLDNPNPFLAALFSGAPDKIPARLKIYRHNIVGSLTDAMLATFPIIKDLTGEEFATAMMRAFILENPPRDAWLAGYGVGFDEYIKTFSPAKTLPYLSDVARLEWAVNESYYASDDDALQISDMTNIAPEAFADLRLNVCNNVRLIHSKWPLMAVRDFCLTPEAERAKSLNMDAPGGGILVFRPEIDVEVVALDVGPFTALNTIANGATLGEAMMVAMEMQSDFDVQSFLSHYINMRVFKK